MLLVFHERQFGNIMICVGLERLLRNRVSAQQARERKKAYLIDLEGKVKELETKNAELEERLSTLQNENQVLRHVRHKNLLAFLFISHIEFLTFEPF